MLNNKSRFKTIAFAICFLLTSISFAKDVALKNTETDEVILSAIKSETAKNNTTVKNPTVKTTTDNDTNHKTRNTNTTVKNTGIEVITNNIDNSNIVDAINTKQKNDANTKEQIKKNGDKIELEDISKTPTEEPNQSTKNISHKNNFNSVGANTGTNTNPSAKSNTNINTNYGIKEIPFADNEQINATLSNRDINRILVRNDKIQSVNGPTGLYTAKNDGFGSAYINLYSDTHFTIFISTVNGHNLSLLVSPKTTSGRTIILEPTSPSLLPAHFEETESYQKILVALITGMINNEALGDYPAYFINFTKNTHSYSFGKN